MPNEGMKISQLPAATEVLDSDVLAGVGGGVTRKFTFATIASYISAKLTALFAAKQDKITANGVLQGDGDGGVIARNVDATPTASSTNLVTSGGVKSALDNAALKSFTLSSNSTKLLRIYSTESPGYRFPAFIFVGGSTAATVVYGNGYAQIEITDITKLTIDFRNASGYEYRYREFEFSSLTSSTLYVGVIAPQDIIVEWIDPPT